MTIPSKVKPGDAIKASEWNKLIDCLRALQILPSAGVRVSRSPSGTILAVSNQSSTGHAILRERLPLEPVNASEGATPKVIITPGTFGGNVGASTGAGVPTVSVAGSPVRIDAVPSPRLVLDTQTRLIYLAASIDEEGHVTGSSVEATTDDDSPANTLSDLYVPLAPVSISSPGGIAIVNVGEPNLRGSQAYQLCQETHLHGLI